VRSCGCPPWDWGCFFGGARSSADDGGRYELAFHSPRSWGTRQSKAADLRVASYVRWRALGKGTLRVQSGIAWYHQGRGAADATRDSELQRCGVKVLHVTAEEVLSAPQGVVARIREALGR
jgi:hypothetical protein